MDSSSSTARQNYRLATQGFLELLPGIGTEDWSRCALGDWTVRDLVGHTSRALLTVESYLQPTLRAGTTDLSDAVAYVNAAASALADPAAVAERGRQAGAALGHAPAAAVRDIAHRVLDLVDQSRDDAVVATPAGTMTLVDYLPTRSFELVVHSLDLAAALDVDPPGPLTRPLADCLQLAAALAAQRPESAGVLLALTGRRELPPGFSVV